CFVPAALAQGFEVGGLALATAYRDANVKSGSTIGALGFRPGASAGAFVGQSIGQHFGGELRYLFAQSDLKVSSGGRAATFSGRTHTINYDLLLYAPSRNGRIRLYAAAGGGLKYYQGIGTEHALQPLSNLALLTRANETVPTVDFGGGVKVRASRRTTFRI